MDIEGLLISDRINEVSRMCDREHPLYEQISGFSIALYVLGHVKGTDLLGIDDIAAAEAGTILKEHFVQVDEREIPKDYRIGESRGKYLLVLGDPLFPSHFAVVADVRAPRPYFSKLTFFGSGFDSMSELAAEFLGKDGAGLDEIAFFKLREPIPAARKSASKIYTINGHGEYSVLELAN